MKTKMTKDFLLEQYIKQGKSTYEIAEELGTYPNKVRRSLVKLGIALRDKSKAQSKALQTGRHKHPTKGTVRTEDERIKISEGMHSHWSKMSEEERLKRSEQAKEQWDAMSAENKDKLRKAAAVAVRRAGKEGSKMEKFLFQGLTRAGYSVIFHKRGLIPNDRLEVDLFLPELKVAIEVDGPSHFFPIWGEQNLQKHISSDAHKSGLLLRGGYIVLRVKHITKSISNKNQRDVLAAILGSLKTIENKFPSKGKRFIELEV
jgi:very-short-patch-repair endonuclease